MRRTTNESIGYIAAAKVAEPLNIPRVGGRIIGKGKLIRVPVCCDFAGTIRGDGRMLLIDFKRNDAVNTFNLDAYVAEHQRRELMNHGSSGAVAGLLIESTRHNRQYWCGWKWLTRGSVLFSMMIDLGPADVVADLRTVVNQ